MKSKKTTEQVHKLVTEIDNDPDNYQTYYDLCMLLINEESFDQAEQLLNQSLVKFKSNDQARSLFEYGIGILLYTNQMYEKAIPVFKLVDDPKLQHDAYLMTAQSYYALSQYKMAFAFALTASEGHKQDPDTNKLLGDIQLATGDLKSARDYYDIALKNDHSNELVFNRGIVEAGLEEGNSINNKYFDQVKRADPKYFENAKQKLEDINKLITNKEN